MTPEDVIRLAQERGVAEARERLSEEVERRLEAIGGHVAWGEACEALGLVQLARREYHLALRDDAADVNALSALAALEEASGSLHAELRLRERLDAVEGGEPTSGGRLTRLRRLLMGGQPESEREAAAATTAELRSDAEGDQLLLNPSVADLSRFVHTFSGREGVHARQWWSRGRGGGYSPIRQALTLKEVTAHVQGDVTLGSYVVRVDDTATFFVLDLDVRKRAIEATRGQQARVEVLRRAVHEVGLELRRRLKELGLPATLVDSGYKGRHLWVFLSAPVAARLLVKLGARLRRTLQGALPESLHLEFFPKQGHVSANGLGSLIKLPLGVHRRSGRRAHLLDERGRPTADPWSALRDAPRVSPDQVLRVLDALRGEPEHVGDDRETGSAALESPQELFTEASFEVEPELSTLLRRCPVLATLVDRVMTLRSISYDEQVVLKHTLGHRPVGVLAVNYLLERCPEVEPPQRLKQPLSGHPISCARIRKRVPDVTGQVACFCPFPARPDHYPTPLLHLDEERTQRDTPTKAEPSAEELSQQVRLLTDRHQRLERELTQARQALEAEVKRVDGQELQVAGGRWRLDDGLRWESAHTD